MSIATVRVPEPGRRERISVYFLAAPEDQDVCKAVYKYLSPIIRNSRMPIEVDSDFDIPVGADTAKYKQRLFAADIVLAFISSDFINNEETYQRNQKVIERYNNKETVMLPILVRNCLWKSTPFVKLTVLPKNLQPLNNKKFWNSDDDALTSVATDISDSIDEFTAAQFSSEAAIPEATIPLAVIPGAPLGKAGGAIRETAPSQPKAAVPEMPRVETRADIQVDVDWRKRYYRRVLLKRFFALLIDQVFMVLAMFVMAFVFAILQASEATLDTIAGTTGILVYLIVCPALESSKWHGTVGKRMTNLQITDREGHSISFFRAFWRNLLRSMVLYSYIFVVPLIIQYFTFKKTKKLFHDQFSNTVIGERLSAG